jgi:LmbE family N-acetylglucosaminyl deacetylase
VRHLTIADLGSDRLRVLALGAHPDDIEIGAAGTILRLIEDRSVASVHWVVCSGDGQRAEEARRGATAVLDGVAEREVVVMDGRDGYLPLMGAPIKDAFEELKRAVTPDLILTHRREDLHQDHRFVSDLTWQTFRDSFILEYEIPKYDGDLGNPNVYIDIPESIVHRKLEILETVFASQQNRPWYDTRTFDSMLRIRGIESRSPSGYAEGFQGRKIVV